MTTEYECEASVTNVALMGFCGALRSGDGGYLVYRNNYVARHIAVLEQNFPALASLLDTAIFRALAKAYVQWEQDDTADINLYGGRFSFFIAEQNKGPRAKAYSWLALSVLAQLDYAFLEFYYGVHDGQTAVELRCSLADCQTKLHVDVSFHVSQYFGFVRLKSDYLHSLRLRLRPVGVGLELGAFDLESIPC